MKISELTKEEFKTVHCLTEARWFVKEYRPTAKTTEQNQEKGMWSNEKLIKRSRQQQQQRDKQQWLELKNTTWIRNIY